MGDVSGEVRRLLLKNGYGVTADQADGAITITLPDGRWYRYRPSYEDPVGIYASNSEDGDEVFTAIPPYAIRIAFLRASESIVVENGFDPELLTITKDGVEVDTFDLFPIPDEDEILFFTLFEIAQSKGFPDEFEEYAEENGLLEGYLYIKELFQ